MKRAVALSGGGSRGAYEVGVWQSLLENNVGYQVVTGTSIGSLNGALMVQRDYELTKKLWETLTIDSVMEDGVNLEYSIARMLDHKDKLGPFLKKYVQYRGADISPLRKLIAQVIDEERVRGSEIKFGLITVQIPSLRAMELSIGEIPQGLLREYLLASSSCFPAFPMCRIGEKTFIDGGYYDNLPIAFAFKLGADEVIAVDLDDQIHHRQYYDKPYVTYIKPSWNLGSILLFDHEVMAANTVLGYNDAQKTIGGWRGFRYAFRDSWAERDYAVEAERMSRIIARLEAGLTKITKNAVLRRSSNPMTDTLAEHTSGRPLRYFDYLLRSLELCAELLGLDHLRVYGVGELAGLLREELRKKKDGGALYQKLRGIRIPADFLAALRLETPRRLLGCVAERLPDAGAEERAWMAASLPKELAAVIGAAAIYGEI